MKKRLAFAVIFVAVAALVGWGGVRLYSAAGEIQKESPVPVAPVKRGDVTFTVLSRGELQGGNSQMMSAPMTGGDLVITSLRKPGEVVKTGDIVAEFDTTEQQYKLREAEADLAEAEQQVAQAEAQSKALEEEAQLALSKARSDLKLAQLDARKNPLLANIVARQNELAVEAARDHLRQLEEDLTNRRATAEASLKIQQAAMSKAKVLAETARKNIDSMTLKAKSDGYVAVQPNTNSNWFFTGMTFPMFQVGDMVRPGMAVAQIPDLASWEVSARIGELDRGHLAEAQPAEIRVIALPKRKFKGKVKYLGGTVGPPWDRYFETRVTLEDPASELRPGMSATITITTATSKDVLWIPAQALFESDGRTFVYRRTAEGFSPSDVKLVRRSESQVVVSGISEGTLVALASPDQRQSKKAGPGSATKAISR